MASLIYLDTHVVVWLFVPLLDRFSNEGRARLERDELRISPIVLLELEYLREIGRINVAADEVARYLEDEIGLRVCDLPFDRVVRAALSQRWTRDPFDRVIVGHASVARAGLLTRDDTIRLNYAEAIW